ncbi:unnamed protein product [Diplocarpon coronariae]
MDGSTADGLIRSDLIIRLDRIPGAFRAVTDRVLGGTSKQTTRVFAFLRPGDEGGGGGSGAENLRGV